MTKTINLVITVLFGCCVFTALGLPLEQTSQGQSRIVGKAGSDVRIPCPLSSNEPVYLFRWYKDEIEIDDSFKRYEVGTQYLRIYGVSVEDSGYYKCQGSDGFGRTKQLDFDLVIIDSSEDEGGKIIANTTDGNDPLPHPSRIVRNTGSDVRMPCPLRSDESFYLFRWYKNEIEIDDSFTRYEVGNEVGTHFLRISGATVEDSGRYKCRAANGFGKTKQLEFNVLIVVDPSQDEYGRFTLDTADGSTEPLKNNTSSSADSRLYPMALIISGAVLCGITIPILVIAVVGKRRYDKKRRSYAAAETTVT